jgi:DNA polymerase-4
MLQQPPQTLGRRDEKSRLNTYTTDVVDASLPFNIHDERKLGVLFLDINAYFATVEQQAQPELRGKPIIVAPMETDSTCAIAASYEAKAYGIKTGTNVGEARRMCPGLVVVPARPPLYVHYHEKIIEAAETVLPVDKVCSIDEMQFRLIGKEREPEEARKLALRMKKALREQVGEMISCSVGVAPNPFLAKLATDMEKPDGLVVLQSKDLPEKVLGLKLTDFCGINKRMAARLQGAGVFSVEQMYSCSPAQLRAAFGSVVGERWWYELRGFDLGHEENERKSLSHSNVMHPEMRTDEGCRDMMLRLIQKASARLRANGLWASGMGLSVHGFKKSWKAHARLSPTQDTVTFNEHFLRLWEDRDFEKPRTVGVVFYDLATSEQVTPSLFDSATVRAELNRAVDTVNNKFGKNTIYLAGMGKAKDRASEKIAFNKTWLFSEGKDDNVWQEDAQDESS